MTTGEWCSNLSLNRRESGRETAGMFGGGETGGGSVLALLHMLIIMAEESLGRCDYRKLHHRTAERSPPSGRGGVLDV